MSKFTDEWGNFTAIPNTFIKRSQSLSDHARWLFVILRFHTNQKAECAWPSYDQLQELTGWSRPSISKAIKQLEDGGWLERRKRFGLPVVYILKRPTDETDSSSFCELLDSKGLNDSSSNPTVVNRMNHSSSQNELQKFKPLTTASYHEQDRYEQDRSTKTKDRSNSRSTAGGAHEVFSYWQTQLNHPNTKLDKKRKRLIDARLEEFSVDDLKAAIDGCKASPFHQGDNDRFRKYDSIGLIFRDAEHVEQFMGLRPVNGNGAEPKKQYCGNCNNGWISVEVKVNGYPEWKAKPCECNPESETPVRPGDSHIVVAPPDWGKKRPREGMPEDIRAKVADMPKWQKSLLGLEEGRR